MGDSAWFFTTDVWGFDLGTFQARARWYKAPALLFHREWGLWFLFVGPFEFSGHGRTPSGVQYRLARTRLRVGQLVLDSDWTRP